MQSLTLPFVRWLHFMLSSPELSSLLQSRVIRLAVWPENLTNYHEKQEIFRKIPSVYTHFKYWKQLEIMNLPMLHPSGYSIEIKLPF